MKFEFYNIVKIIILLFISTIIASPSFINPNLNDNIFPLWKINIDAFKANENLELESFDSIYIKNKNLVYFPSIEFFFKNPNERISVSSKEDIPDPKNDIGSLKLNEILRLTEDEKSLKINNDSQKSSDKISQKTSLGSTNLTSKSDSTMSHLFHHDSSLKESKLDSNELVIPFNLKKALPKDSTKVLLSPPRNIQMIKGKN